MNTLYRILALIAITVIINGCQEEAATIEEELPIEKLQLSPTQIVDQAKTIVDHLNKNMSPNWRDNYGLPNEGLTASQSSDIVIDEQFHARWGVPDYEHVARLRTLDSNDLVLIPLILDSKNVKHILIGYSGENDADFRIVTKNRRLTNRTYDHTPLTPYVLPFFNLFNKALVSNSTSSSSSSTLEANQSNDISVEFDWCVDALGGLNSAGCFEPRLGATEQENGALLVCWDFQAIDCPQLDPEPLPVYVPDPDPNPVPDPNPDPDPNPPGGDPANDPPVPPETIDPDCNPYDPPDPDNPECPLDFNWELYLACIDLGSPEWECCAFTPQGCNGLQEARATIHNAGLNLTAQEWAWVDGLANSAFVIEIGTYLDSQTTPLPTYAITASEEYIRCEAGNSVECNTLAEEDYIAQAIELLTGDEGNPIKELLEKLKVIRDFLQDCQDDNWASYNNQGIIPHCFWKNAVTPPALQNTPLDPPPMAGMADAVYQEIDAILNLPETLDELENNIDCLRHALIKAYLYCDYGISDQSDELSDVFRKMINRLLANALEFTHLVNPLNGSSCPIDEISCEEATQTTDDVHEILGMVDSWEDIKILVGNIQDIIAEYVDSLGVGDNEARYEIGRLTIIIASIFIPAEKFVGITSKAGRLKKILEEIRNFSPNKLDEFGDALQYLANGRGNRILLEIEEALGGHSIGRHGAHLSLDEMRQRVVGTHPTMPQTTKALKFKSDDIHIDAVNKAFQQHKDEILAHFNSGNTSYLKKDIDYGAQVGDGYYNAGTWDNPIPQYVTTKKVQVAFKADPSNPTGYILDSAYPLYVP